VASLPAFEWGEEGWRERLAARARDVRTVHEQQQQRQLEAARLARQLRQTRQAKITAGLLCGKHMECAALALTLAALIFAVLKLDGNTDRSWQSILLLLLPPVACCAAGIPFYACLIWLVPSDNFPGVMEPDEEGGQLQRYRSDRLPSVRAWPLFSPVFSFWCFVSPFNQSVALPVVAAIWLSLASVVMAIAKVGWSIGPALAWRAVVAPGCALLFIVTVALAMGCDKRAKIFERDAAAERFISSWTVAVVGATVLALAVRADGINDTPILTLVTPLFVTHGMIVVYSLCWPMVMCCWSSAEDWSLFDEDDAGELCAVGAAGNVCVHGPLFAAELMAVMKLTGSFDGSWGEVMSPIFVLVGMAVCTCVPVMFEASSD